MSGSTGVGEVLLGQAAEEVVQRHRAAPRGVLLEEGEAVHDGPGRVGQPGQHVDVGDVEGGHQQVPRQPHQLVERHLLGGAVAGVGQLGVAPVEVQLVPGVEAADGDQLLGEVLRASPRYAPSRVFTVQQLLDLERHQGEEIRDDCVQPPLVELFFGEGEGRRWKQSR